jgi:hypothetical protein
MRPGLRMLVPLFLCAAAGAAALAHVAIDIVGDFALPHDTYDAIAHGSRELVAGIALAAAVILAFRGLRICFDVAVANRGRLPGHDLNVRQALAFFAGVLVASGILVPAMELLDARLDGTVLGGVDDAFGGSMLLGLAVTAACVALVAGIVFTVARLIVSYRDTIEAIVVSLLGRANDRNCPNTQELRRRSVRPHRHGTVHALRLCKRGPPRVARSLRQHCTCNSEGEPRASLSLARSAIAARDRHRAVPDGPGGGRPSHGCRAAR